MNVLIVDDSAVMRKILTRAMQSEGWDVYVASCGEEALSELSELPDCDLILADWHMPGMDGLDLIRAVRADSRYQGIRILMVTSDGVLDSVEKALDAGANDLLMKPFTADALSERIREVMCE